MTNTSKEINSELRNLGITFTSPKEQGRDFDRVIKDSNGRGIGLISKELDYFDNWYYSVRIDNKLLNQKPLKTLTQAKRVVLNYFKGEN